ncbi:hypothetical protein K438DRAFT_1936129 [Mycena galopus ATCC 62051]|nr:hypothetical protein K438DRAFT_1936129 [Mycena galopus ATCC 62051]
MAVGEKWSGRQTSRYHLLHPGEGHIWESEQLTMIGGPRATRAMEKVSAAPTSIPKPLDLYQRKEFMPNPQCIACVQQRSGELKCSHQFHARTYFPILEFAKRPAMIFQSILAPLILTATLGQASQTPRSTAGNGTVIDEKLSSLIQDIMQAFNLTGVSVGILSPSGEAEFGAWGNRSESGEKVASDTIFGIGSLSKGFMSASLGILMQDFADGKNTTALPHGVTEFNWDTKMRDLLPGEWMTEDEFSTEKANLVDLFSHVTGLPALVHRPIYSPQTLTLSLFRDDESYSPDDSPRDLVLRMRHLRTAYEFRQLWEYNNQTFDNLIVVLYNAKKRQKMRENVPKRDNGQPQQLSAKITQHRNKFS